MSYAIDKLKVAAREHLIPGVLFRVRAALRKVPDANLYSPHFQPWRGAGPFRDAYKQIGSRSLVAPEQAFILYSLAQQALAVPGDYVECGVYRGGTARLVRTLFDRFPQGPSRQLHLFDTFAGMPDTDPNRDLHRKDDFADTSVDGVSGFVGKEDWIKYHAGFIPDTFRGLESMRIAFAHVDVDIHRSIIDSCEFIYPRLAQGGIMVFDDYGVASCPGARAAVDEFFAGKPEVPLVLRTGQAVVFRSVSAD
jgi:O-methyltransferase